MPDISPILLAIAGGSLLVGALIGWFARSRRVKPEKEAIHASWQEQISAQRAEHDRIVGQNKNLMEQVSQFRATQRDADGRANDLSAALKTAVADSEGLRVRLDEASANLDAAAAERDRLREELSGRTARDAEEHEALREKDRKIFKLSTELETWKNRLPPLMEKFRERNLEAEQLEVELEAARAKAAELERRLEKATSTDANASMPDGDRPMDETRVEPMENSALTAGLSASNEQYVDEAAADSGEPVSSVDASRRGDTLVQPDDPVEDPPHTGDSSVTTDDLKRIKGVGPAMEKALFALGITRFEQVAGMSEIDIDRVAQDVPGFKSRIYREDWMGQARTLQEERSAT